MHINRVVTLWLVLCSLVLVVPSHLAAQSASSRGDHSASGGTAPSSGGSLHSSDRQEPVYSPTVLALYNSNQGQTERENEIVWYLANPLKEFGLTIRYHDIAEGVPENIDDVRAVISWFRGGTMAEPGRYLEFMRDVIRSGRKYVILGNMGAFGDSDQGEYLAKGEINRALSLLGLRYEYGWTDDPDLLEIVEMDSQLCECNGKQDVYKSRFYYRFVRADRDLDIHLSLRRKDKDYEDSPVIVTNPNGGYALGSYIYHQEEGTVTMLLDLKQFLAKALFWEARREYIGILVDDDSQAARAVLANTEEVLQRAKLPYQVIEKRQFSDLLPQDLFQFTAVGLALESDAGLNSSFFTPFFEHGGGLVSLVSGRFSALQDLLAPSGSKGGAGSAQGYRFDASFPLGEQVELARKNIKWAAGNLSPQSGADVIATDYTGSIPLLWRREPANGSILVWNWKQFADKTLRGFILESFLAVRPVGAAGTPGVATLFIDDWPLPMYNAQKEPIEITDTEFYTTIWWPDMKELLNALDIPASCYLIFEYNSTNTPPYVVEEFFISKGQHSVSIAREILDSRHELAFHGYNHVSLLLDKSNPSLGWWPDKESIVEALHTAREEWVRLFGEHIMPQTYVATHNSISEEGIRAVREVFPSIRVIGTVLTGLKSETTSEFRIDPKDPLLYYLPRLSSGFFFNDKIQTALVSAVSAYGIWTHFIHPDDIYDPHRSHGKTWKELKKGLEQALTFARRHYPWLRFVTAREAGTLLRAYDAIGAEFSWAEEKKRLTVRSFPGFRFRLRINQKMNIEDIEGASPIYRYKNTDAIVLEATASEVTITFR